MMSQSSAPAAVHSSSQTHQSYDLPRTGATVRLPHFAGSRAWLSARAAIAGLLCFVASGCAVVAPDAPSTAAGLGLVLGLFGGFLAGFREGRATTREEYRAPIARARMHVRTLLRWAGEDPQQLANVAAWERLSQTEGALLDVTYPEPARPYSWELRDLPAPRARVRP